MGESKMKGKARRALHAMYCIYYQHYEYVCALCSLYCIHSRQRGMIQFNELPSDEYISSLDWWGESSLTHTHTHVLRNVNHRDQNGLLINELINSKLLFKVRLYFLPEVCVWTDTNESWARIIYRTKRKKREKGILPTLIENPISFTWCNCVVFEVLFP